MDHELATATQAAERYVLGELTPEQKEDFEEHFFSCSECAEAVRMGSYVAINTKAIAKEETSRPSVPAQVTELRTRPGRPAKRWVNELLATAAAVLLGIVGFQNLVTIPQLQKEAAELTQPRALSSVLLRPQTRSGNLVDVRGNRGPLVLQLDLSSEEHLQPFYVTTIQKASGGVLATLRSPVKDGSVEVSWPSSSIAAGDYEILVREVPPARMDPVHFAFHFEK